MIRLATSGVLSLFYRRAAPRSFPGTSVGLGSLPPAGQASSVTPPSITPKVHKPFDAHGDLTSPIALDNIVIFNDDSDPINILGAQVIAIHLIRQVGLVQNLTGRGQSYTKDVGQRPIHVFVAWQIHTRYTCQVLAP
jgi:hypothetical protein